MKWLRKIIARFSNEAAREEIKELKISLQSAKDENAVLETQCDIYSLALERERLRVSAEVQALGGKLPLDSETPHAG